MSSSQNNIIALGVTLLKEGVCQVPVEYKDVFELLRVDISTTLQLKALKSVFFKSSNTSVRYYPSSVLSSEKINYPIDDVPASVKFDKIDGKSLTHLEKYGSFVAVDGCDQIPVYDLFKTAAGLYDCLEKGKSDKPFLLVTADFSGIQDTVYTISSKGALKTLRARSFMLELLTEHIIYELLQASRSDRHAIIYSGGGGFSLLLPNIEDNVNAINDYRDILNRWAFTEFSGKLFIALDALECNKDKLKCKEAFKELRQTQADNLDKLKRRKFIKQLDELFTPTMPEQLNVQTECQITRRDDLLNIEMRDLENGKVMPNENPDLTKIWVSESCYHQFKLGDKLIEGYRFICRSNVEPQDTPETVGYLKFPIKDSDLKNLKYCWYYLSQNRATQPPYWQINSWEANTPTLLFGNYVRKHGGLSDYAQEIEKKSIEELEGRKVKAEDTATFEGLAASSCGANLIGALRMDVDNMGNLFSKIGCLTELSTKSRILNLFFKVYLNQICSGDLGSAYLGDSLMPTDIIGKNYTGKNEHGDIGRNVSVVYAGGDDLFILGAWDETTELTFDIQRCFALFTGGLGISGGLTLHQPKFPLYQMVKKSGEAEHVAKNEIGQKNKTGQKNRIALFYSNKLLEIERSGKMEAVNKDDDRLMLSINWKQFKELTEFVSFFASYRDPNEKAFVLKYLSNSFTYSLLDITSEWHEKNHLSFPHLLWLLKKHNKDLQSKDFKNEDGLSYFKSMIIARFIQVFPIFHLPLIWIELLKRRG